MLFDFIFKKSKSTQLHQALTGYLEKLGVTSFLVEYPYIDNDYLEDFANFYASNFHSYERHCHRIHFFKKISNKKITTRQLNFILNGKSKENIAAFYLGYLVVKPFNKSRIGRTCLKTYGNDTSRNRLYFATRTYSAHLYGITLPVESMAFQEQDKATTACASIALWSALHLAGKIFQRKIPSPSVVTRLALSDSSHQLKFPNKGLTPQQICSAITHSALVPYKETINSHKFLKAFIYAYGIAGLPIIGGLNLYDHLNGKVILSSKVRHAITINGYSFEDGRADKDSSNDIKLFSSRIKQIYAHDDQLCPFSKLEINETYFKFNSHTERKLLNTFWKSEKLNNYKVGLLDTIIIPLHPNIRVQFPDIYKKVIFIDKTLKRLFKYFSLPSIEPEWRINLIDSVKWKNKFLESRINIFNTNKSNILKSTLPKYIWQVRGNFSNDESDDFELIFDSTESKTSHGLILPIYFRESFMDIYEILREILKHNL